MYLLNRRRPHLDKAESPSDKRVPLSELIDSNTTDGNGTSSRVSDDFSNPSLKALASGISFSPEDGRIWMNEQRMFLFHDSSFGSLREQVINAIGYDAAKQLFMRSGYTSGCRDADLVRQRWPNADPTAIFEAGPQMHSLEGAVHVETIHIEFDRDKGTYSGEFYWHNSCESEQHVKAYGVSTEPVCWMELGYAMGYVSSLLGTLVIFREMKCQGMGHEKCRVVGKNANAWPKALRQLDFQIDSGANLSVKTPAQSKAETKIMPSTYDPEEGDKMIGVSAAFVKARQALQKVAGTRATVLLTGESGVGKELFAHTLHKSSRRAAAPFVAFNCAAIPENLLEAELFGVDKGAFTGASQSRAGRFERADGGTLFLDELGTLSPAGQSKLLRALQEQEIERVGGTQAIKVDVRVVAATNLDLREAVKRGDFREDLFFRLNVFPIAIPTLKQRRDDIPLLLDYFFHKFCVLHDKSLPGITLRASRALFHYDFPGNIREIQNIVERGVIWAEQGEPVDLHHMFQKEELPELKVFSLDETGSLVNANSSDANVLEKLSDIHEGGFSLDKLEKQIISEAVESENGNLSAAARRLGITRAQLAYRLKKA